MNRSTTILTVVLLALIPLVGCSEETTTGPAGGQKFSEQMTQNFTVAELGTLEVDNLAGNITIRPGQAGTVRVVVTKWASRASDLSKIQLEMVALQNGVRVETENPLGLNPVTVDLEITVPPDSRQTVRNGAGQVTYEGRAEGICHFSTGAGTIRLELPADINVTVDLVVGAGTIFLDFPVQGQVGPNKVEGTIGTGADGDLEASVGAGNMHVVRKGF